MRHPVAGAHLLALTILTPACGARSELLVGGRTTATTATEPGPTPCPYTSGVEAGAPWPMFGRCPDHSGRSPLAGPANPTVRWSFKTGGPVWSSPVVGADGTVYIGSNDGKLYALTSGGAVRWTFDTGGEVMTAPALASDGTVYVGSESGSLFALRGEGEVAWTAALPEPPGEAVSSPTIGPDGTLYVSSLASGVQAWTPSGAPLWTYASDQGNGEGTPAVGPDGTVYATLGGLGHNLVALGATGEVLWTADAENGVQCAPSLAADGTLYLYTGIYTSHMTVYAVGPGGAPSWSRVVDDADFGTATPVLGADGTVYVLPEQGQVDAFAADGAPKWTYVVGSFVDSSPAIGADGTLYFGSASGALNAVSAEGLLRWSFPTGGEVISSPAIGADGTLYFGSSDGSVYALGP